ncbi:hypothetical protein AALO_G00104820 [Alosa alosa]|uniref:Secreted protein n=1 Tax=Alosa alosa TaxID=278164 RepID=A0AAV6GVS7_9TELE|nr:hypothetical protein AALO_G00104820 [Alosa alosa]
MWSGLAPAVARLTGAPALGTSWSLLLGVGPVCVPLLPAAPLCFNPVWIHSECCYPDLGVRTLSAQLVVSSVSRTGVISPPVVGDGTISNRGPVSLTTIRRLFICISSQCMTGDPGCPPSPVYRAAKMGDIVGRPI